MREEALLFGQDRSLVGVLTQPPDTSASGLPAVLLLNAGILHRAGPNRLYVKIARSLAAMGFVVLRFDFSGIGDSLPRPDAVPFEHSFRSEVQDGMYLLQSRAGSSQFVLMGLCSGAVGSYHLALDDPRVVGAALINPRAHLHDAHDQELDAALRERVLLAHYRRLVFSSSLRWKTWHKAVAGSFDPALLKRALTGFTHKPGAQTRIMLREVRQRAVSQLDTLVARGVRLLHVFSEGDEGLDYFRVVLGNEAHRFRVAVIRGANHTFSVLWSQAQLVDALCAWAKEFVP